MGAICGVDAIRDAIRATGPTYRASTCRQQPCVHVIGRAPGVPGMSSPRDSREVPHFYRAKPGRWRRRLLVGGLLLVVLALVGGLAWAMLGPHQGGGNGQTAPLAVASSVSASAQPSASPSATAALTQSPSPTRSPTTSPPTSPTPSPTVAALAGLSPAQLAGQRVIYSYKGLTPPARLLSLISHGEAAGVIFFSDNIASEAQIKAVIATLQRAAARATNPVQAPLLLMTDQEGGEVRRLPGAPLLSEKEIGAALAPAAAAAAAGASAALNLRRVGMNVNLAPVLDVYRQAGGFDDRYGRSYSSNPSVCARLGADFIAAQQRDGVAACAKHFPGLGAATLYQNTDLRPVTLNLSRAALATIDELPYHAAIAANVRLVMVSWAIYPALAPQLPAGLSSVIVQGQLRQALHFQGVTITDSLGAKALQPFGSTAERATRAAAAGMDLILCALQSVNEGERTSDGLATAYVNGQLNRTAFQAAVQRIVSLRLNLGT